MSKSSFVLGYIGPKCTSNIRREWNAFLREQGSGGMFDFYRTTSIAELELRLSEMFVLQRRGYIVDQKFEMAILPLLDELDESAEKLQKVDTVLNRSGILVGHFFGCEPSDRKNERVRIFLERENAYSYIR